MSLKTIKDAIIGLMNKLIMMDHKIKTVADLEEFRPELQKMVPVKTTTEIDLNQLKFAIKNNGRYTPNKKKELDYIEQRRQDNERMTEEYINLFSREKPIMPITSPYGDWEIEVQD